MPEQPTLTHVATTLQFCLEQLQLCEAVLQQAPANIRGVATAVSTARACTGNGLRILATNGITPAEPEGAVPA